MYPFSKASTNRGKKRSILDRGRALPEPLRQQFYVITGTSIGLFFAGVALIGFRLAYGRFLDPDWFRQNVIVVFSVFVSLYAPIAVLDQRSPKRATALIAICVLANCVVIAVVRGGFWGLPFVWLTIIPMIVTTLAGVRMGVLIACAIGSIELSFYLIEFPFEMHFPVYASLDSQRSGRYFEAVTGLAFVSFFTWMITWTYRRSAYEVSLIASRKKAMEERQRVKSEFVAMMSHELRTPLNAVIGFSRIMYRAFEDTLEENERRPFDETRQLGEQLLSRIDDILDVERLESGMLTRSDYAFEIDDLFKSIVEQSRLEGIRLHIQSNLEDHAVVSDPERLQRLLLHFVNQARSTTDDVRLTADPLDVDAIVISVDGRATGTAPHRFRSATADERGDREFSLYMAHLLARFVDAHLILEDQVSKLVLFREPKR